MRFLRFRLSTMMWATLVTALCIAWYVESHRSTLSSRVVGTWRSGDVILRMTGDRDFQIDFSDEMCIVGTYAVNDINNMVIFELKYRESFDEWKELSSNMRVKSGRGILEELPCSFDGRSLVFGTSTAGHQYIQGDYQRLSRDASIRTVPKELSARFR